MSEGTIVPDKLLQRYTKSVRDLEVAVRDLQREVSELKARRPVEQHIHHHHPQVTPRPYQPYPYPIYPNYPTNPLRQILS